MPKYQLSCPKCGQDIETGDYDREIAQEIFAWFSESPRCYEFPWGYSIVIRHDDKDWLALKSKWGIK